MALRIGVSAVLFAAAVYILVQHWETVLESARVARGASIPWLATSVVLMAGTFCIAAGVYGVLALHRLRYLQTVLVEVSTAFVNRLLPSGLGGLGIHGVYLYGRKHTGAEATVVVSVNNLLGMLAHLLLLVAVVLVRPQVLQRFMTGKIHADWRVGAAAAVVVAGVLAFPVVRRKLLAFGRHLLVSVRKLALSQLTAGLLLAALLTITYTLILFCAMRSLGLHLGVLEVFIVFSIGMLVGTATPTPGGLVGAEAGLFAGFVAYGVTAPQAGAVVLLYRLVTYWLPIAPGVAALAAARRARLL